MASADPASSPPDFVWGAATSSYQIEGAVDTDGRGESIWDRFCRRPGAISDGSDGSVACDHYHRMTDDVALMADLGLGAYRFSVAWPRVIPNGGSEVNPAGLDFYDRLVDTLLAAGIAPYATLYHWDLPQVLEDGGGWTNRATADAFAAYAEVVVSRLGDRVASWATLNEPFVSASHGYRNGWHAPGRTSLSDAFAAAHHLLVAHGRGLEVVRSVAPEAEAGIVVNFTPVVPADHASVAAAAVVDGWENRWYIEPLAGLGYPVDTAAALGWGGAEVADGDLDLIAAPVDVLGINFYTRQLIDRNGQIAPPRLPVTAMEWEIDPPSLGRLLRHIHDAYGFGRYLITENGMAAADEPDTSGVVDDQDRIAYLAAHLAEVAAARADGIPVAGYFVWSLFDNFEWAFGYEKRFGLVRVDFDTLTRTPKASALWYRDLISARRP